MKLPSSPFTRTEAFDSGLNRGDWRQLVAEHRLREVYPGWFVEAEAEDTVQLRIAIMRRILDDHHVLARRSAAWVQGLNLLDYRGFPTTPPVEVVTRDQRLRPRTPLITAYAADDLIASDVIEVDGLRVTSPLRTAADLARLAPRSDALVSVDAFLHQHLFTPEEFEKSLVRWKKRRGVRQAWEIADLADGRSESGGESRMRLRVIDLGLPRPECQIDVVDPLGVPKYRLDMGWRRWRLALEYDGEEFHGEEYADHDEKRREWIARRGWRVEVFKKEHIFTASRAFEDTVSSLVREVRWSA
jgi:hypothetical protein